MEKAVNDAPKGMVRGPRKRIIIRHWRDIKQVRIGVRPRAA